MLGKNIQRPAKLDKRLARELKALSDPEDPYDTVTGKTLCTYDFYEGEKLRIEEETVIFLTDFKKAAFFNAKFLTEHIDVLGNLLTVS